MGAQGATNAGGLGYYPRGYLIPRNPWGFSGGHAPYGRGVKTIDKLTTGDPATVAGVAPYAQLRLTAAEFAAGRPQEESWFDLFVRPSTLDHGAQLLKYRVEFDTVPNGAGVATPSDYATTILVDISAAGNAAAVAAATKAAIDAQAIPLTIVDASGGGDGVLQMTVGIEGAVGNKALPRSDEAGGALVGWVDDIDASIPPRFHYGVHPEFARPAVLGRGRGLLAQAPQASYVEHWFRA